MSVISRFVRWMIGLDPAAPAIARYARLALWVEVARRERAEISVTDHAAKRLIARMRCDPRKVSRIAEKAWRSLETSAYLERKRYRDAGTERIAFRLFSGCVFVFIPPEDGRGAVLKTVINPGLDQ